MLIFCLCLITFSLLMEITTGTLSKVCDYHSEHTIEERAPNIGLMKHQLGGKT